MISYHDASRHNNFCKCTHSSSVFTEMDEWGYWDVCNDCHKPIEDTYGYNSEDYLGQYRTEKQARYCQK